MGKESDQGKRTFELLWIAANTFSWGISFIVAMVSGWAVYQFYQSLGLGQGIRFLADELSRILIAMIIYGFCWGAIVGLLQQAVLGRRYSLGGRPWALATMLGLLVFRFFSNPAPFFALIFGGDYYSLPPLLYSIFTLGSLFALGVAQWFILRRYFEKSGWWIVATAIALWPSTLAVEGQGTILPYLVASPLAGLIYGVVTLIALIIIFKRPTIVSATA